MTNTSRRNFLIMGGGSVMGYFTSASAHDFHKHHGHDHFFTPHVRPFPGRGNVSVKSIGVSAEISSQVSVTRMVIEMENTHRSQQEGQALIPVPHGAVLKGYTLEGATGKFSAKLMPREEARRIYDSIVNQLKDPALLEFAGESVVKSSVFPIPANGTVKLELVYEMLLERDGARIDYYIPRSQSLDYKVPWKVAISWKLDQGVASVYSPSHPVKVKNVNKSEVSVTSVGLLQPGAFRLSLLAQGAKEANATFYAYPDENGKGGHFLMLMAPPAPAKDAPKIKREVTVVFDKSGSMAGEKIDQVRAAALQVIEGLEEGEAFNIIVYNESVEMFSPQPVLKSEKTRKQAINYLRSIRVSGGTNINQALNEALQQKITPKHLPLVLFLTDGVPTIGITDERKIRNNVEVKNPHKRRIFSFGVGVDVNTPLLNAISTDTRALASFVLPKEDVELKVAQVFRRLSGPVLQNPSIRVVDEAGENLVGRVSDLIPGRLSDMYYQDQVVLLGRYVEEEMIKFVLAGDSSGGKLEFKFKLDTGKASNKHGFVPRLWATRKISLLIEALRELGAGGVNGVIGFGSNVKLDRNDPKVKELIDEVVRLSLRYGVMTEYTAFLATDGKPIAARDREEMWRITAGNIEKRALKNRKGYGSVNQEKNIIERKAAACLNLNNQHWNARMKSEQLKDVQQIGNKTYYRSGNDWVDAQKKKDEKEIVVSLGSKEFSQLVDNLLKVNEQGCLSLSGDIKVSLEGKNYLIKK